MMRYEEGSIIPQLDMLIADPEFVNRFDEMIEEFVKMMDAGLGRAIKDRAGIMHFGSSANPIPTGAREIGVEEVRATAAMEKEKAFAALN